MILYGSNISPFARGVAVWCALLGREIERRPLRVMGQDFETLKGVNPVGRVPILVLEDGAMLIETFAICDWLDDTAAEGRRLVPEHGVARRDVMQEIAYANATTEKAVALVYEKNRRPAELHFHDWIARLEGQIGGGLAALEARAPEAGWLGGEAPSGGDVAFVMAHDFIEATNPHLLEHSYPRLAALAKRANAEPAFSASHPSNM